MISGIRLTTHHGDAESMDYRRAMRHQEQVTVKIDVPASGETVFCGIPVLVTDHLYNGEGRSRLEEWELVALK